MAQAILAAGLTPAWQQILAFDAVQLGEVNRARESHACASGKVLNVGLALHRLGANVRTLSLIGGPAANQIEAEFVAAGAERRWVYSGTPTRTCTTIVAGDGSVTELVENAQSVSAAELEAFTAAYRQEAASADVLVLTGSLPAGTDPGFYQDLIVATSGKTILDTQGPPLLQALSAKPFLVKPNREELARTLGRDLSDDQALINACNELHERGAQWVIVSSGKHSIWASGPLGLFRAHPPTVDRAINPIGSGDCLAAGLAWRLALGESIPEALCWGIAAAVENVRELLPARLDLTRVDAVRASVTVETVQI